MSRVPALLKIAITTGDVDGIGLEVTLKALLQAPLHKGIQYCIFRNKKIHSSLKTLENKVLKYLPSNNIKFLMRESAPPFWVQEAAHGCLSGEFAAMATAPLSKETIQASGFTEIGHTDILKTCTGAKHVHMAFIGQHFNVVLATGHVALSNLNRELTEATLGSAIQAANNLRRLLPSSLGKKPIALLGLNPHAGENGIIGTEELSLFKPVIAAVRRKKIKIVGPLVPDAAFFKENWSRYSVFVCPYHDQGLIPFKMIHGRESGVHLSLGLPIIRTSADHGTAKDIFGKNRASSQSMLEAITWEVNLSRKAKHGI